MCPRLVILHLMYAVRPMDTLTLGELSMRGSSSPRMVAEGNRKDGGARVDASDGSNSEGANPKTGRQCGEEQRQLGRSSRFVGGESDKMRARAFGS